MHCAALQHCNQGWPGRAVGGQGRGAGIFWSWGWSCNQAGSTGSFLSLDRRGRVELELTTRTHTDTHTHSRTGREDRLALRRGTEGGKRNKRKRKSRAGVSHWEMGEQQKENTRIKPDWRAAIGSENGR